eukprot:14131189-Alexandrium_andersonii.AAC.1
MLLGAEAFEWQMDGGLSNTDACFAWFGACGAVLACLSVDAHHCSIGRLCGHRGVRVGEARRPGPTGCEQQSCQQIHVASANIIAFIHNFELIMALDTHLISVQEHALVGARSQHAVKAARSKGYAMLGAPA